MCFCLFSSVPTLIREPKNSYFYFFGINLLSQHILWKLCKDWIHIQSLKRRLKCQKKRKILSKLRWFGFGTSGQNQTFGSIQTRSVMLIFISSFKILIIFNSGRIKQTCATLVFRKILTLLRMWRHHSASLQKYSKVEYIKERQSPYLCCVFYFKSISCLVFAWEHNKKDTFSQYFKFRQMSYM